MFFRYSSILRNAATDTPTGGGGAPAVVPAATTAAATVPASASTEEPAWLPKRLEQATRNGELRILESLGVKDVESAKQVLAAAAAKAESEKSAEQRAADLTAKLAVTQTAAERSAAVTKEYAARMLGVLTPEQKQAVTAIAGDDATEQLRTINALAPVWAKEATDAAKATAEAAPPANTSPPPTAPNSAGTVSPPDHKAVYQAERNKNPFAAAAYGLANSAAVYK